MSLSLGNVESFLLIEIIIVMISLTKLTFTWCSHSSYISSMGVMLVVALG